MIHWLLLILSLPTENATARMRAWRALKGAGAGALRDGVYLLPDDTAHRATLDGIGDDVRASGGSAHLFTAEGDDFSTLFDRTADYQQLAADIAACEGDLDRVAAVDLARLARKMQKTLATIRAIDFFPGPALEQTAARFEALDRAIRTRLAPDEPMPSTTVIVRREAADYRGRHWATRQRPWVDRLASAWLIRRFIDPDARFVWLESPADCPDDALGFDFDGAEFSHVGAKVTFETLLASFGHAADPALARLGELVHCLDVGGLPVAEAPGIEILLAGLRASEPDDDALLARASEVFDWLLQSYKEKTP